MIFILLILEIQYANNQTTGIKLIGVINFAWAVEFQWYSQ